MKKVFAKNNNSNVREMPNTGSKILDNITVEKGLEYILTTPAHNGKTWYALRTGNETGYVRSDVAIIKEENNSETRYKDVIIQGSRFPDKPYVDEISISFSNEILNEYIPEIEKLGLDRGFKLLLTIMANKEGFTKKSRSYRTNNPGNIGNTDSGKNSSLRSLKDGILLQKSYIERIVNGLSKTYPMGKKVIIKPYYSEEIAKNQKNYAISPWLPGYEFIFTGQLDQFVKIYSTGARAGNSYINQIVSYFKNHRLQITPESRIQDIIKLK